MRGTRKYFQNVHDVEELTVWPMVVSKLNLWLDEGDPTANEPYNLIGAI